MTTSCPHAPRAHRKTVRPGEATTPAVEVIDGIWHVRVHDLAKEVLRAGTTTVQAGFNVDMARGGTHAMREPILFMDGPEHKKQRSMIARYFAPATVDKRYRDLMAERADRLVGQILDDLDAGRVVELSDVSLRYSVEVAAQVIGLTESDVDGMAARLEGMLSLPARPARSHVEDDTASAASPGLRGRARGLAHRFTTAATSARALAPSGLFYLRDVKPAIEARRAEPGEDVISHLLAQGYSDAEILSECVTYGAAGMVTTREYICVVTWHLLTDPELLAHYLGADQKTRYDLLHEILRLEPVVGHLYRRATEDITLTHGGEEYRIPAGAVLDLSIRAANADPDAVGPDPLALCPGREVAKGTRDEALSFGDGPHRCPGNALAIQETDILLTRLLAHPLVLAAEPHVDWLDLIAGYEIRGLRLARA